MRRKIAWTLLSGLLIIAVSLFFSCSNQMSPILPDDTIQDEQIDATVYFDSSRDTAVFVDKRGTETLIQSEEEDGIVSCAEVIDYKIFGDNDNLQRGLSADGLHVTAIVLGKRSDGSPGLWMVWNDGRVRSVINEEDLDTSELLEIAEKIQYFSKFFGWSYEAVDMAVNDDGDEIIIIGYAVHKQGIKFHTFNLEPGTTIGVYWAVRKNPQGFYHISRAKVIGVKDSPWWLSYSRKEWGSAARYRHRWMWVLRHFFWGWYDRYLTMPDNIEVDGDRYNIYGTDHEGDDAVAVVTAYRVLSIEKSATPPPTNNPPEVSFATWDYEVRGAKVTAANQNYSASGTSWGRTRYTGDGNPAYELFNAVVTGVGFHWCIDDTWQEILPSTGDAAYYIASTDSYPPESGWKDGADDSTSDLLITEVPISGDVSTHGNTLTAKYEFTDSDGDSEGDSLYQWYRCDSESDEGTAISGADELEYTTDSADDGKYLKIEVTPVDEHGLSGTPVKSEASRQIGST